MTAVVVFAAPWTPPTPPPNPWPGLTQTWTGWDGSVWDVTDAGLSGVGLRPGVRGLGPPQIDRYTDVAAGVAGSRPRGYRPREREVFWPLQLFEHSGSEAWLDHDAAFWRTLDPDPDRMGIWTVTRPDGASRHLTMQFVDPGQDSIDLDPSAVGWAFYELYFVAPDPYWHGPDILATGGGNDGTPFIDAGGAPPFYIAGGSLLSGMAIANPGDVEAWPVWEAVGPHPDLVVGLGSTIIECPPLAAGEHLVIDTSPWVRTVLVDGVDALDEAGAVDFAPIPARGSSTLAASSSGSGTVACRISPRYRRAW